MTLEQHVAVQPVESDASSMTIELLRARLLSERAVSKAARQKAQKIADKVADLQARLDHETAYRKKAEAAAQEVFAVLKAKGLVSGLDALLSCCEQSNTDAFSQQCQQNPDKAACFNARINLSGDIHGQRQNLYELQQDSMIDHVGKKYRPSSTGKVVDHPSNSMGTALDSSTGAMQSYDDLGSKIELNEDVCQHVDKVQPSELVKQRVDSLRNKLVQLNQEVSALPAERPSRRKLQKWMEHLGKMLEEELTLVSDTLDLRCPDGSSIAPEREKTNSTSEEPDEKIISSLEQKNMKDNLVELPETHQPLMESLVKSGNMHAFYYPRYSPSSISHHTRCSSSDTQIAENWRVPQMPAYSEVQYHDFLSSSMRALSLDLHLMNAGVERAHYAAGMQRDCRGMNHYIAEHGNPRRSDKSTLEIGYSKRNLRDEWMDDLSKHYWITTRPSYMDHARGHLHPNASCYSHEDLMGAYYFPTPDLRLVPLSRTLSRPPVPAATISLVDDKNGRLGCALKTLNLARHQLRDNFGADDNHFQQMISSTYTMESRSHHPEALQVDMEQLKMNYENTWGVPREGASNRAAIIHLAVCPSDHRCFPLARSDELKRFGCEGHVQSKREVHLGNGITLYTD